MKTTRRALLAASLASLAATSSTATTVSPALRFLRVRHRTLLVDIGDRRALIDPCFAPGLGAGVLFDAPPPSVEPEEVGDLDLLLISAREPGAFDGESTRRLRGRGASCFVGDESTAKILRHQGYRRVRVVVPGDRFVTRGVAVSMSPSRTLIGTPAVGFHLERAGRTLWHAGAPPPLDVVEETAAFARDHPAEVVVAAPHGLSFAGQRRTLDREDALLLAGLSRARYAALVADDVGPSVVGGLLMKAHPGARRVPAGARVRLIVVEPGRWYRVAPTTT